MTITRSIDESSKYDCMGYATFVQKMNDPEFSSWFSKLKEDISVIAVEAKADIDRLARIHSRLIDLIDFLDPQCIIVPPQYRTRIEHA